MGSISTKLQITNNTSTVIGIRVSEVDSYDWEHERPDNNFQHASLNPHTQVEHSEDLNSFASSAPFRMTMYFQGSFDNITFRVDQRGCLPPTVRPLIPPSWGERVSELGLGGPSSGKYFAVQVIDQENSSNLIGISRRIDPSNWMSLVRSLAPLSSLTIPGTHNSGARAPSPLGTATCQDKSIKDQLDAGIRFLDVRCRHIQDVFTIHHEAIFQNLNFGSGVRDVCLAWLAAHPTETILMRVQEEYEPEGNHRTFEATFDSYLDGNRDKWFLDEKTPNIGDVRGKIVLLRRFRKDSAIPGPKGINIFNGWPGNASSSFTNGGITFHVQDRYAASSLDSKQSAFSTLRDEAARGPALDWYVNFVSWAASLATLATPKSNSNQLNPWVLNLSMRNPARMGIVAMDYPESPALLIPALISQNDLLGAPERPYVPPVPPVPPDPNDPSAYPWWIYTKKGWPVPPVPPRRT